MDRLYPLIATVMLLSVACDSNTAAPDPPPGSRVNAVVAKKADAEAPTDFCDVYHASGADAPPLTYPELTAPTPADVSGWRWINLWATWCKPCIEEMPRLAAWETELAGHGLSDVLFLSADESDELVTKFRADHPDAPESVRMTSPDALQPWLNGLGLAGAPSLPVHVFVDGTAKVRCIRMGGVTDRDRGAVERLLHE